MNPENNFASSIIKIVMAGFQETANAIEQNSRAIQEVKNNYEKLMQEQKQLIKATYKGATNQGKARFVASLVKHEIKKDPTGAQSRVAEQLDLSPGRISQLVKINKQNGK